MDYSRRPALPTSKVDSSFPFAVCLPRFLATTTLEQTRGGPRCLATRDAF